LNKRIERKEEAVKDLVEASSLRERSNKNNRVKKAGVKQRPRQVER